MKPIGGIEAFKLLPADRSGDRSAGARTGGVGGYRRGAAVVAQPVDENPPLRLALDMVATK